MDLDKGYFEIFFGVLISLKGFEVVKQIPTKARKLLSFSLIDFGIFLIILGIRDEWNEF